MKKRTNPYTTLLEDIRAYIQKCKFTHVVSMFYWSTDKLTSDKSWRLDGVYHRCMAAKSLGYEVFIDVDENGMAMKYRKLHKPPYPFGD